MAAADQSPKADPLPDEGPQSGRGAAHDQEAAPGAPGQETVLVGAHVPGDGLPSGEGPSEEGKGLPGGEGPGSGVLAGLAEPGQRLLARIVDTLVVGLPVVVVVRELVPPARFDVVAPPAVAGLLLLYEWIQLSLWGRTLGKRFAGIEVVPVSAPAYGGGPGGSSAAESEGGALRAPQGVPDGADGLGGRSGPPAPPDAALAATESVPEPASGPGERGRPVQSPRDTGGGAAGPVAEGHDPDGGGGIREGGAGSAHNALERAHEDTYDDAYEGVREGAGEGARQGTYEEAYEGGREGTGERVPEGIGEGAGQGGPEATLEGAEEGGSEGFCEGEPEGRPIGRREGVGEGEPEGTAEGAPGVAGEGALEGSPGKGSVPGEVLQKPPGLGFGRSLLRSATYALPIAVRPVPVFGLIAGVFWVGNAALMYEGTRRQTLHDRLAATIVVKRGGA